MYFAISRAYFPIIAQILFFSKQSGTIVVASSSFGYFASTHRDVRNYLIRGTIYRPIKQLTYSNVDCITAIIVSFSFLKIIVVVIQQYLLLFIGGLLQD